MRGRDGHDDEFVIIEAHRLTLCGHHADDAETPISETHPCAYRLRGTK